MKHQRAMSIAAAACCLASAIAPRATRAGAFYGLGDFPGNGVNNSQADGISADGNVAVGYGWTANGNEAFRWTAAGGLQPLGDLPGGVWYSQAKAVSGDGATIVGQSNASDGYQAFRWTAAAQMERILLPGFISTTAEGVSANGAVVVGHGNSPQLGGTWSFRWAGSSDVQILDDLPGGSFDTRAHDISDDGNVIVGHAFGGNTDVAFRWTPTGGTQTLPDLPGGDAYSQALAVSGDGTTIVGAGSTAAGLEALRWTEAGGMQPLGDLHGGIVNSAAYDTNADGSVIVGAGHYWPDPQIPGQGGQLRAFVWDEINGMRDLRQLLIDQHGIDLSRFQLEAAVSVSDDGRTISGWGFNLDTSRSEAWVANIPEPAGVTMLAVLGGALCARWRRAR